MIHTVLLILHMLTAVAALLLGMGAMRVTKQKGWHSRLGNLYHWLFVIVAATAALLATLDWQRLWWFLPVAIFSYAFALLGFAAAKYRWKNWMRWHVTGQGGSFIAMSTAAVANNLGHLGWLAWLAPTAIGVPILMWFSREVRAGRRPKYNRV
ncbi:MAG TPA: hypothetical protein VN030_07475 [Cellvibrio sp.]|nr:hypothetical protein [Cellvibrio sp.]